MDFKNTPFGDLEKFNVLIEIPKGSSNKLEYDQDLDAIRLDFVFEDLAFPFNYGSIAGTLGGDGDHLDAIVLSSYVLPIGILVPCKPIGMMEILDRGEQDNKIICIPVKDPLIKQYEDIADFSEEQLREWEDFHHAVAVQKNKIMEIKGFHGKDVALAELEKCRIKKN